MQTKGARGSDEKQSSPLDEGPKTRAKRNQSEAVQQQRNENMCKRKTTCDAQDSENNLDGDALSDHDDLENVQHPSDNIVDGTTTEGSTGATRAEKKTNAVAAQARDHSPILFPDMDEFECDIDTMFMSDI